VVPELRYRNDLRGRFRRMTRSPFCSAHGAVVSVPRTREASCLPTREATLVGRIHGCRWHCRERRSEMTALSFVTFPHLIVPADRARSIGTLATGPESGSVSVGSSVRNRSPKRSCTRQNQQAHRAHARSPTRHGLRIMPTGANACGSMPGKRG
jgi:hypothetical protein